MTTAVPPGLTREEKSILESRVRYDGYIRREKERVEQLRTIEGRRIPEGFEKLPCANYSADGQYAAWVEKNATRYRLQLLRVQSGLAATLLESNEELRDPLLRPHNSSLVYRRGGETWSVQFDAKQNHKLPLAEGETLAVQWTADGHALEYLNRPPDPKKLTSLREWIPENGAQAGRDARVADTSQFVRFRANADASVNSMNMIDHRNVPRNGTAGLSARSTRRTSAQPDHSS